MMEEILLQVAKQSPSLAIMGIFAYYLFNSFKETQNTLTKTFIETIEHEREEKAKCFGEIKKNLDTNSKDLNDIKNALTVKGLI